MARPNRPACERPDRPARLGLESLERRDVPAASFDPLIARIDDQLSTSTGRYGIAVVDLADGSEDDLRGDQVFGTSSTIKLGVLYALMRRVDADSGVSLSSTINVGSQYGTNQGTTLVADTSYSLRYLAETMIDDSNNWATNRLIDYLGVGNINGEFADLGLTATRIDRYNTGTGSPSMHGLGSPSNGAGVFRDYAAGHDNESTPNELTEFLRAIHENDGLLTQESYDAYWEIMGLNGSGLITAEYSDSLFPGAGEPWQNALDLFSKPGSNSWNGNPGTFTDDPTIGNHFQRSEAGRIVFSDGRVVFYAAFVDEAEEADPPFTAIGRAGFEIAREFATGVVTITPAGAELADDRVLTVRGTDGADDIRIETLPGAPNTVVATLNGDVLREYDTAAGRLDWVYVFGGLGDDTITLAADFAPADFGAVALSGGGDADTIDVSPSTVAEIIINGDGTEEAPGDVLLFRGPGTLTLDPTLNLIERDGFRNVGFVGIETFFQPPTVTAPSDPTVFAGGTTGALAFTVGDAETPADELTVTFDSSNPDLVPASGIELAGSGATRTVRVTPAAGRTGTATITLTVTDATGATTSDEFVVTVEPPPPPNTPPQISNVSDQTVAGGTSTGPLAFTVGDAQTPAGGLAVTATSSDTALVPVGGIAVAGAGANRTVTVTPTAGRAGTVTITLIVADADGATATDTFTVTVLPPVGNTPPQISDVANRVVVNGTSAGPYGFTVGDAQTPADLLLVTARSSDQALVPDSAIAVTGAGAFRAVTVTPTAGLSGTATITITVQDAAGATVTDTFALTVLAPGQQGPGRPLVVSGLAGGIARPFGADGQPTGAAVSPFGGFGGDVRVAAGDFDADGISDTVLITGPGIKTAMAVVSGRDGSILLGPTDPFGDANFTFGGFVTAGDLDGDGRAEWVITPELRGGPRVIAFRLNPADPRGFDVVANFFGIQDPSFRDGARAALGDVNGDGILDVFAIAAFNGGPRTALFNGADVLVHQAQNRDPQKLAGDFFAALSGQDEGRGGRSIAAGDVTGDGIADFIVTGDNLLGTGNQVTVFSGADLIGGRFPGAGASPVATFAVGGADPSALVSVARVDADGDAQADVAVGSGAGQPSRVKVYRGADLSGAAEPASAEFDPFGTITPNGVFVG